MFDCFCFFLLSYSPEAEKLNELMCCMINYRKSTRENIKRKKKKKK